MSSICFHDVVASITLPLPFELKKAIRYRLYVASPSESPEPESYASV